MLISQNIKNIVSGISQQAPILRLPEQLEEQENGFSSEANGLVKRPPTVFVKALEELLENEDAPLIHFVDRSKTLKYFVYFYNNKIYVFDTKGRSYPVRYKEDESYIAVAEPQKNLRVLTVADHTFITNNTVVARMGSERSPDAYASQGALINVKQGQYGRTYRVDINGSTIASYTTPDGSDKSHITSITTDNIANQLATAARNNGWTVTVGSSWLYIYGKSISKIEVYDGYSWRDVSVEDEITATVTVRGNQDSNILCSTAS